MDETERARLEYRNVLLSLIGKEFGTQSALGEVVGLSRFRISQIVNPAEPPTFATIERIIDAFPMIEDKETIYRVWQRTFAPAPKMNSPSPYAGDEEILEYVATCRKLHDNGKIGYFLGDLTKLWAALYKRAKEPIAALAVGSMLAECWYLRDNRPRGLDITKKLEVIATQHEESERLGQALWLRAIGERTAFSNTPERAEPAFEELLSFAEGRRPKDFAFGHKVRRDSVLLSWAEIDRGSDDLSQLKDRLSAFQHSLAAQVDTGEVRLGKEVEARALVAIGKLDQAHEALTIAFGLAAEGGPFQYLKTGMTKARLLLAAHDTDCERLIAGLVALADGHLWIHYGNELRRLRSRLFDQNDGRPSRLIG